MTIPVEAFGACEAVKKHIDTPIPSTLWHYTNFGAFQKIVTSKKVWATEYRFLNDREELIHAKNLAHALLAEMPVHAGAFLFPAKDLIGQGLDAALHTAFHEERHSFMMASFSEEGDQLSQWRGYAGASTGVSLGLDLRAIRPPGNIGTTATFAPCIYKESEKRAMLGAVVAQYQGQIQKWWESVIRTALKTPLGNAAADPDFGQKVVLEHKKEMGNMLQHAQTALVFDFMRVASFLKSDGFSEEKEWRLALPRDTKKKPLHHPMEFRPVRDALVPYIAFPLPRGREEDPIPCNDVILGPGCHPSAEVGINMFLADNLIRVHARQSKVPYRPA